MVYRYTAEGEAVENDEDPTSVPYSTPSGFSIPMAPGSGLTGAYTPTASPVSTPASTSLLPPTAQVKNKNTSLFSIIML